MKIQFSAGILFLLAAMLLLLPLPWVIAALLAAAVHETFHLLAVYALGGKVYKIIIGGRGAVIHSESMSPGREFICTLAGPMGSLFILLFARWLPRTAVCGLIHGVFNLLPLLPLDGGRILRCLLFSILSPPRAQWLFALMQRGLYLLFIAIAIALVGKLGILMMVPLFFLLPRVFFKGTIEELSNKRYGYDRNTETNPAQRAEACQVHRRRI